MASVRELSYTIELEDKESDDILKRAPSKPAAPTEAAIKAVTPPERKPAPQPAPNRRHRYRYPRLKKDCSAGWWIRCSARPKNL